MDWNDFIRINNGNLESTITTYTLGNSLVSILAWEHFSEQTYFNQLMERASEYDFVLVDECPSNQGGRV